MAISVPQSQPYAMTVQIRSFPFFRTDTVQCQAEGLARDTSQLPLAELAEYPCALDSVPYHRW